MKFLLLATLLALAAGCTPCTPAQQAKLDLFECQVHALAPLVEPVLDAADLVRDLETGKADLRSVLGSFAKTQAEVDATLKALRACAVAELPVREPPTEETPS